MASVPGLRDRKRVIRIRVFARGGWSLKPQWIQRCVHTFRRHARAQPSEGRRRFARLWFRPTASYFAVKAWMPATSAGMTAECVRCSLESIEVSATIPNERTPQFELFLSRFSDPVLTPCLAQLRASSRGVELAERGVAPAAVFRKHRSGTPRVTVRSTMRAAFNGWTGPDERRGNLPG